MEQFRLQNEDQVKNPTDIEKSAQVKDGLKFICEATSIDPIAEKNVRRKIDLFLMPAMMIGM